MFVFVFILAYFRLLCGFFLFSFFFILFFYKKAPVSGALMFSDSTYIFG